MKIKGSLFFIFTIFTTSFIFYNSIQNGTSSSGASDFILRIINTALKNLKLDFDVTGHIVRKTAHFVEFFILGTFVMLTMTSFTNKGFKKISLPLFIGIFIPVIDEYIQVFSNGRTSSIKDVLLDFSGSLTGIVLVCILFYVIKRKRKNTFRFKYKY